MSQAVRNLAGAFLIDKEAGPTSNDVLDGLKGALIQASGLQKRDLPGIGHGGTLDPFATGLLVVLVGRGAKLAQYFLDSRKSYEGLMRFGETTIPGDPTEAISQKTDRLPSSLEDLNRSAEEMTLHVYEQIPPMHSAKKVGGKRLYELAREGKDIDRPSKAVHLYEFEFSEYASPLARFQVSCSSGTYIRKLAQDFAILQGSLGMLDSLRRTASGHFNIKRAWTLEKIAEALSKGESLEELECWVGFDDLLSGYPTVNASDDEAKHILQGRQNAVPYLINRMNPSELQAAPFLVVRHSSRLLAIVKRNENKHWGLERVFPPSSQFAR